MVIEANETLASDSTDEIIMIDHPADDSTDVTSGKFESFREVDQ